MGIIATLIRNCKNSIRDFRRSVSKWLGRAKRDEPEHVEAPRSWQKRKASLGRPATLEKAPGYEKHKLRVPHLLFFKRALAAILLLFNFVFSQFLLGAAASGAQPMFLLFLLNCFICADYLWKTRRKEE